MGTLLVAVLAVYAAYGTVYAATHKGNVEGEQFNPMLMLRLYANWGMFAPNPPSTSGWFIIVGQRKNSTEIDVWNDNDPVDWKMPELPSATYRTQRWRKFLDNIVNERHAVVRPHFLRWMCKNWNESHSEVDQVRSLTLYQMAQTIKWPERSYTEVKKNSLQQQGCPSLPGKLKGDATSKSQDRKGKGKGKGKSQSRGKGVN